MCGMNIFVHMSMYVCLCMYVCTFMCMDVCVRGFVNTYVYAIKIYLCQEYSLNIFLTTDIYCS